ncbi:MAG: biotin--[acetyl-CoA-carboxylase] ligase, partial [Parasphingopyxis sp.]
ERLDRPATDLAARIRPPAPDMFLQDLAAIFARHFADWRSQGIEPIRAAWLERAHPEGTELSIHEGNGATIVGLFDGLAEDGALMLRLADGETRVIHAGDVFLL